MLTGYIDNYLSEVGADRHAVRVTGRSKTEDIVDCTPDIKGGQFAGYKLDAIARAIASLFKIDVVVQTDVVEPFPDATIERHETGFAFLERLCRLRSVLATDDEQGRLVLTRAGNDRTHDALLQGPGSNVQWASAVISGAPTRRDRAGGARSDGMTGGAQRYPSDRPPQRTRQQHRQQPCEPRGSGRPRRADRVGQPAKC